MMWGTVKCRIVEWCRNGAEMVRRKAEVVESGLALRGANDGVYHNASLNLQSGK